MVSHWIANTLISFTVFIDCFVNLQGVGHSQPAQIHVIPISVVHQGGGNFSLLV